MATDHIKMAHAVLSGDLDPDQLDAADFKQLLNGLEDLYLARVLSRNPSVGDSQTEWVALAVVLKRAARMAEEGQQRGGK